MLAWATALALAASCTQAPEFYEPFCRGGPAETTYTGRYDPSLEVCVVAADLERACEKELGWWGGYDCPGFEAYVQGTRPEPDPFAPPLHAQSWGERDPADKFTVLGGCIGADERSYDVVDYNDQWSQELTLISRAVFDADGVMVWLTYTHGQGSYAVCCVPDNKSGISEGWGTPVYEDCTNAKVYTPLDFPETGDTGAADTSDTATPGDTGASDTSDTGSGA